MIWGIAWYWYAIAFGFLIPWVSMYRDLRDEFDESFMWGMKIYLGVCVVTVPVVVVLSFLARLAVTAMKAA